MAQPGASLAQRERSALCDLLADLGPDAPTLCEGWRSADLAAHLYIRDPGWGPRGLGPDDETALWGQLGRLRTTALVSSRIFHRPPAAGRLEAPGKPPLLLTKAGEGTVVKGPVGELVMWLHGRKQAARVETTPPGA